MFPPFFCLVVVVGHKKCAGKEERMKKSIKHAWEKRQSSMKLVDHP